MPGGAAAGSGGLSSFGVSGVRAAGNAAIASQTAGFAPLITGGGGGVVSSAATSAGLGFNPLYALMGIQSIGTMATAYNASKAASMEGEYSASVAESNARIMAIKAQDAIVRGDKAALKARQATKLLIGDQRAAMGAQGIDLESGSALDIQKETASLGAEESLNIKNNAWREAWGYRVAENDLYGKAKYSRLTAKNTSRNTILTGGLTVAKNLAYANYLDKSRNFYSQGSSALYGEDD